MKIINKKLQIYLGVFFIALSMLMFELVLIRLFSVILFTKQAFLAISVALFGIAIGGIIAYFYLEKFEQKKIFIINFSKYYSYSLFVFAFALVIFKSPLVFISLAIFPFIFANVCLSLILKQQINNISKVYFFDLVGAGLGVILTIIILNKLVFINTLLFVGLLSIIAYYFFALKRLKALAYTITIFIFIGTIIFLNFQYGFLKLQPLLAKFEYQPDIEYIKGNSFSLITLENFKETWQPIPSVLEKEAELPPRKLIRLDGDAATPVYNFDNDFSGLSFLDSDMSGLAYQLFEPSNVLVIGSGGGRDILMGLMNEHQVKAVEINPIINNLMKNRLKEFNNELYYHPLVDIVQAEARSYLKKDNDQYRVISLPLVDTWSSTLAGNLALVESNLYTVEAFVDYFNHLEAGGVLNISRWEMEGIRLISLFLEASNELSITSPEKNIVVISNGNKYDNLPKLYTYLFKKSEFTERELGMIDDFINKYNAELVYFPGKIMTNDYYNFILSDDKDSYIANYQQKISPVHDNDPFFFFTNPFGESFFSIKENKQSFTKTFYLVISFSLICLFFPIIFIKKLHNLIITNKKSLWYLSYFSFLGLAFIIIEMVLIQKFVLYLEQPIYSYSVILATILIAAGIGSYLTKGIKAENKNKFLLAGMLVVILLIMTFSLSYLINLTISQNILIKIIIASLVISPAAVLMGMMLPLGFKNLEKDNLSLLVPWSWALNGAMSVLGSVLAIFLAILYGFNIVIFIGAVLYFMAMLILVKIS
jgi:hypothetical protein